MFYLFSPWGFRKRAGIILISTLTRPPGCPWSIQVKTYSLGGKKSICICRGAEAAGHGRRGGVRAWSPLPPSSPKRAPREMGHLWLCCAAKAIFPLDARFPWEFQHSNSDCSLGIVRAFQFSGATGCASGDAGLGQTQDSSGLPVPIRGEAALCYMPPPRK